MPPIHAMRTQPRHRRQKKTEHEEQKPRAQPSRDIQIAAPMPGP